jgi:oxygen-independent coproporphyrinogen-3 oxidase
VLPDKNELKTLLMEGFRLEWERLLPVIKGSTIQSVYFGGGTPWLFGAEPIAELIAAIEQTGTFDPKTAEITLEANPENVTEEKMRAYAQAGINRISVGIQSLDPHLLTVLDRKHSADKAKEAVYIASDCGIDNITIDLMYDLPQQNLKTWENTLQQVQKLPITHLSLYNLTFEPHTVFYKYRERLQQQTPNATESLQMYEMAIETFQYYGLKQYEISAFAKPGKHSRHNTGYWLGRPFLGLGPSAFSDWEGARYRNIANLSRYVKALKENITPVDFYEKLEPEARRRELLAVQMRLLEGVDLALFQEKRGFLNHEDFKALETLQENGFISFSKDEVRLTKRGILFYDTVASEIV